MSNEAEKVVILSGVPAVYLNNCFPTGISSDLANDEGLTNELVYTDNVNLSADDERGGLSSRIAPRISVQGSGRGMKLNFGYSPAIFIVLQRWG